MSEDEQDASADEPKKKAKSKKPILLILAVVVLVGAAAAAGVFLAPALAGAGAPAAAVSSGHGDEGPDAKEGKADEMPASLSIDPIVVDLRDAEGELHHLKVVLSFELRTGVTDGEFRPFVPRAREAAIAYLRSQSFETLTGADRFEEVRQELAKTVSSAVGEKKAKRVLITDFVAQ